MPIDPEEQFSGLMPIGYEDRRRPAMPAPLTREEIERNYRELAQQIALYYGPTDGRLGGLGWP